MRARIGSRRPRAALLAWLAILVTVVLVLAALRDRLDRAHVALVLLLVVLGASASGGRAAGLAIAGASFLAFNWTFLPPYRTLAVADPLDWLVLAAFLATSIVAAQLLYLAQEGARRAEHAEALREADRVKDALLAGVSHDLRTPLTTIKARAHELRVYGDEGAEVIEQEADRLNRMVADLLDLSRLQAGELVARPELNAADELAELVVQRVEGALDGRTLDVRLPGDGALLFGWFDLAYAVRIVVNLVENARRYAPPGTAIELALARRGDRIAVSVCDRGPGLSPDEAARAFEPFRRAVGPSSSAAGGAGLGLAIARQLAEAQGGSLTHGDRPGGGSVFTLLLPLVDDPGTRAES